VFRGEVPGARRLFGARRSAAGIPLDAARLNAQAGGVSRPRRCAPRRTERGEVAARKRRLVGAVELVELRRASRASPRAWRAPAAMVDLVLEEVREDAAHAVVHQALAPARRDVRSRSRSASPSHSAMRRRSRGACSRARSSQRSKGSSGSKCRPDSRCGASPRAAALEHLRVEPVHREDVVEGGLDRKGRSSCAAR
jgi:hypothetical protein